MDIKFEFQKPVKEISYLEKEPLKLHQELQFFHNKSFFRKDLVKLQYLFQDNVGMTLRATAIRDTYLREEFTEEYMIVLLSTNEVQKKTDTIIEGRSDIEFKPADYYIEVTSEYLLLLTKDMDGLASGLDDIETILNQTFKNYFQTKN